MVWSTFRVWSLQQCSWTETTSRRKSWATPASRASSGPSLMQVPLSRNPMCVCADGEVIPIRLGFRLSPPIGQASCFAALQMIQELR